MNKKMEQILHETKGILDRKGLDGYDLILNSYKSLGIKCAQAQIDQYNVSQTQSLGFRVIKDQKVGLAYTEDLTSQSIAKGIDWAIENAKNTIEVPEEGIHAKPETKDNDFFIRNREGIIDSSKNEEKLNFALQLEKKVLEKEKVKACPYNGFSENESEVYYLNSSSHFTYDRSFSTSCYTSALLEKDQKNSSYYDYQVARSMSEFKVDALINEIYDHANNWLEAIPLSTGDYDVIFSTNCLASIFGRFSTIFSGTAAKEGTNPFFSRIGENCFFSGLTIIDDPTYGKAFTHSYFDSEGFPVESIDLVRNGKMSDIYHNSVTAKKLNCTNNYRASRGPRSPLGVSGTNTIIQPGSEKGLELGEVFKIYDVSGLHSGANPLSGDFAFGASGYLVKDGEVQRSVKNVTVGGNFFKMLSAIEGIDSEIKANSALNFFSPDIRFSKLKIAGS